MSTPEPKPPLAVPATTSVRRKWGRRLVFAVAAILAATFGPGIVMRLIDGHVAFNELAAARSELDHDDPGWQLDEFLRVGEAEFPPPGENSAEAVARAAGLLPADWPDRAESTRWGRSTLGHTRVNVSDLAEVRRALAGCEPAAATADALVSLPSGGTRLVIASNVIGTRLAHVENARRVCALLTLRSYERAASGRPDDAIRSAHAALNAARSIGDDPFMISQVARRSLGATAARIAVRAVALGEPTAGLAELQRALIMESDSPVFRTAARGERATIDRLFENMAAGTLDADARARAGLTGTEAPFGEWLARPMWQKGHAAALRLWHRAALAADRPYAERVQPLNDIVAEVESLPVKRNPGNTLIGLMLPAFPRLSAADTRMRALETAAAAGLACERYRQRSGRWPDSLAAIPKDIQAVVPLDPFDGQPLRLRRLADGVAIYSVGENGTDDGGDVAFGDDGPGPDVGFRLWDANQRNLPPLETAPPPREVAP